MSKAKKQVSKERVHATTEVAKLVTPVAPKKKENNYDEVKCANGCGTLCHPDEYVRGYCSRACFIERYRMDSDDF